jgi:hypothetical protein
MRTAGIVAVVTLMGGAAAGAQTSLTIYHDGRVLQRRTLPIRVPAGPSSHRLMLGQFDLGSLFALDSGVTITGAQYDAAQDQANALRRAVGRRLAFATRGANGAREVTMADVLAVDPERYRLEDGLVTFQAPGIPLFPAELVPLQSSLSVGIKSDKPRTSLGLGFFSGGASWSAVYAITLGKGTARVAGHAAIQVGAIRADSVEVQLLAGNVGSAPKAFRGRAAREVSMAMAADVGAAEQAVGEAHLYTLAGRLALVPGVEASAALFEPATAPLERTYTVRGELPYWGGLPQSGDEQPEPVNVTYVIKRPAKTEFGDRPVPGGTVRLYERDTSGRPQLVGESSVGHTAAGQDLRLDAGTAFDLTARRVQTAYETRPEGKRTLAMATYAVTIANAKDSVVSVDVLEQRGGEWSVVSSSVAAEKVSSTVTRFRVKVPARGETTLTYRVRVVW